MKKFTHQDFEQMQDWALLLFFAALAIFFLLAFTKTKPEEKYKLSCEGTNGKAVTQMMVEQGKVSKLSGLKCK